MMPCYCENIFGRKSYCYMFDDGVHFGYFDENNKFIEEWKWNAGGLAFRDADGNWKEYEVAFLNRLMDMILGVE